MYFHLKMIKKRDIEKRVNEKPLKIGGIFGKRKNLVFEENLQFASK